MKAQEILDSRVMAHAYNISEYGAPDDKIVDPRQLLRTLVRRLPLFFLTSLATFLAVAVLTFQAIPTYSTSSSIIIDSNNKGTVDLIPILNGAAPDSALVETEVEILRSRTLAEKIVTQLNLVENAEFNSSLQEPGLMSTVKSNIKGFIRQFTGGADAEQAEQIPEEVRKQRELDAVISSLLGKTRANRMGNTYGISIVANSHDPELAARIANSIADQYLVEQLDAKFEQIKTRNSWLEVRLAELKAEVADAERTVEAHRAASGLISSGETTINEQQIRDINAQLIVQRADLTRATARLNAARGNTGELSSSSEALSSPSIQRLQDELVTLRQERADLQTRLGPRHPDFININLQLADIQNQIRLETARITSSLEKEVEIARQQVRTLENNLDSQRSKIVTNNRALVKLRELERNAEASRTIYEDFLGKFKQSEEVIANADARILSRAAVPRAPSFPKTSLNLAIGMVLGMMLGTLAVILAEALNNKVTTGESLEGDFGLSFLGNFPKLTGAARKSPADYVIENPTSSYAESLRNLRASIMFADLDTNVQTVAVTSSQPDEGKTTTTYGLGRMSALSGTRTLVIDGDFRRKQLTDKACPGPEKGFLECLFGEASLEEAIVVDQKSGLHLLPLTANRHTPRDVFGSKAFDALLDTLRQEYELIIIDTGPILLMAETRVLTSKVDQVVIIARWQKTSRAVLKQTVSILRDFRANIAGIILNQVDLNKYHKHGYGHSGYKAYAKYYSQD